jgi:hypothetical protein
MKSERAPAFGHLPFPDFMCGSLDYVSSLFHIPDLLFQGHVADPGRYILCHGAIVHVPLDDGFASGNDDCELFVLVEDFAMRGVTVRSGRTLDSAVMTTRAEM